MVYHVRMKNETMHQFLVRRLREVKGIQSQIAKDVGCAQATVNRIANEGSKPSVDLAERLVAWFLQFDKDCKRAARHNESARQTLMRISRIRSGSVESNPSQTQRSA
jgi:DNA-binding XRE family transcriptional regulator